MWEWIKTAGNSASNFFKDNADALKGAGALISGGAGLYSAIQQGKQAQKTYNLNLDILKSERRRQQRAQNSLDLAWQQSLLSNQKPKKDDENLGG